MVKCIKIIAQKLYNEANGDNSEWYSGLSGSGLHMNLRVKIHPTETLYTEDGGTVWKCIGSGEIKSNNKKRKEVSKSPTKNSPTRKRMAITNTAETGGIETSELMSLPINTNGASKHASETKQQHYKIYKGDEICTMVDVGDIWSMKINGKPSCGVTLKARHMIILNRHERCTENTQEQEESEEEIPDIGVFD